MSKKIEKNKVLLIVIVALAIVMVAVGFITSTTYTQLAISSLLYPPLAYFAFKLIPATKKEKGGVPENYVVEVKSKKGKEKNGVEIIDIDKRAFLKMIGAAGVSFFIFSLFTRKVEDLLLSGNSGGRRDSFGTGTNNASPEPTEEYKITEISTEDHNYYGFVNLEGNWYIMKEDPVKGSFRYSKGNLNFSKSWNDKEKLKYDYYHNVFN